MLSTMLFLSVVGGSILYVESSQLYKCDAAIVSKIKDCWNGNPPNDILEKAVSYGKLLFKQSTDNYLPSQYKGAYVYFTKEDGNVYTTQTLSRIPKEGGELSTINWEVIEAGGAVTAKSDKSKRYPVYKENGIIACYSCIDSDKAPTGPPAGFILTRASGYCEDDFKTALNTLKSVDVDPEVVYSY